MRNRKSTISWDEIRLTCKHGVLEGLDYHDCEKCKKEAIEKGLEWIDKRKTYIFTK